MPDHPIIFSGQMVRALLEGRKTQTRRLAWRAYVEEVAGDKTRMVPTQPSPWQRVRPGDKLWVRESAWIPPHPESISERDLRDGADTWRPSYHADGPDDETDRYKEWGWKSRPSIHMPRWASRLTLHVEAVRVERLQAISEEDAGAEGVTDFAKMRAIAPHEDLAECQTRLRWRQREFAMLWDQLHGPGAWDANPEVVVITFRVERRNIDHDA